LLIGRHGGVPLETRCDRRPQGRRALSCDCPAKPRCRVTTSSHRRFHRFL